MLIPSTTDTSELPDAIQQRIEAADADTLLRWSERVLTAQTLDEVLNQDERAFASDRQDTGRSAEARQPRGSAALGRCSRRGSTSSIHGVVGATAPAPERTARSIAATTP